MVCNADDLVVLCWTREEARQALEYLRQGSGEAGLTVHPTETRIVNAANHAIPTSICRSPRGWRFETGGRAVAAQY